MVKGITKKEKLKKIQSIFTSSEFFQLKEIEKKANKLGISPPLVKDLVNELINDQLIVCEKIGTSNYYWAFPTQFFKKKKEENEAIENKIQSIQEMNSNFNSKVEQHKAWLKSRDYVDKMQQKEKLKIVVNNLTIEFNQIKSNDPEIVKSKMESIQKLKLGIIFWIDNIIAIKKHCNDCFGLKEEDFDNLFNIPNDLDDLI
ncbi:meiotic nuclear division protein 1 [Neoconidiobolus thromboides FSU 785]|nr:meiotic nuclear division protein 1 [Neoconidiobolus thromboides FSU 785]